MKKIMFMCGLIIFVFGCGRSLKSTTKYYESLTSQTFAAKSQDTVIPIVSDDRIRRPYKIIGEMEFESGASDQFIIEAVQYNARINGADAILFKQWEKDRETYVSWDPGWYYYPHFYGGYYSRGLFFSSYYTPTYDTHTYVTNQVKAQMIVFLDKETVGYLGLMFEDVRNVNYLEVGKVVPGSPADRAGFKAGDKILRIDGYSLDKGLEHFYKNVPLFKAGQSYEVEYMENGEHGVKILEAEHFDEKVIFSRMSNIETGRIDKRY